jgi:SagB-type dehydrogenase family enzyme
MPVREPDTTDKLWCGGTANQLSNEQVPYPLIDRMHAATKLKDTGCGAISEAEPAATGCGEIKLSSPAASVRTFGEVVRTRRSALDFEGGRRSISLSQLSAILTVTAQPFSADFAGSGFIQLYLYAHRVDGLAPGVYRYWPHHSELEQIKSGDQRVAAAGLSLGQDLAGNACVAFSMIADLDRATRAYGDRGYCYAHFEAGAIGHRLYLAAEALGLGSTGIGAFFDDEVHRYLDLPPAQGQVVYHFAIGYPVSDPRLMA